MIRCLLVDDEPLALRVLEKYVAQTPGLTAVASCSDAFQALEILGKEKVELLLLDINMPTLSGIRLLQTLSQPPLVIFTTAYSDYAVEGFELEAVDYLLKPFSLERFLKAIQKVQRRFPEAVPVSTRSFLLVKADKKLYRIPYEDILYLQAYGDYVKVFTKEDRLLTKERLTYFEKELPESLFLRIHRSHIIALSKIEFIEGNLVKIGAAKLPVSENYRTVLFERLKAN